MHLPRFRIYPSSEQALYIGRKIDIANRDPETPPKRLTKA